MVKFMLVGAGVGLAITLIILGLIQFFLFIGPFFTIVLISIIGGSLFGLWFYIDNK